MHGAMGGHALLESCRHREACAVTCGQLERYFRARQLSFLSGHWIMSLVLAAQGAPPPFSPEQITIFLVSGSVSPASSAHGKREWWSYPV